MKRWHKWLLGLLLLALLVLGIGRAINARKAQQAQAAAPKTVALLELAETDLVTVRQDELQRMLEVSGSLVAVNSAFVKARVAAEGKSVGVREGVTPAMGETTIFSRVMM